MTGPLDHETARSGCGVRSHTKSAQAANDPGCVKTAINESGTHITIVTPGEELKAGEAFAKQAGCPDAAATCLLNLGVKQIFAHQGSVVHLVTEFPSADGTIITDDTPHAFRTGDFNHVPIMTGLVQDEQSFFMPETQRGAPPLTAERYDKFLGSMGAAHKAALAQKYPMSNHESRAWRRSPLRRNSRRARRICSVMTGRNTCPSSPMNSATGRRHPIIRRRVSRCAPIIRRSCCIFSRCFMAGRARRIH